MSYERVLENLAAERPELVVMTAENRAAIRNLPQKLGERFIDVGICEQTMIGAAAGMALRGRIPVCHALATFLVLRAYEFIRTDVGIARLPVKLVGGVPGFLSEANGPTHQAIEDVAVLRCVPHMQIVCPADEVELVQALPHVIASPEPTYVRFCATPAAVEHATPYALGKAEVFGDGDDVALLTYGFMLREAQKARALLERAGVGVRLLNLRSIRPLDRIAVLTAARRARLVVTLEDHLLIGGLYSVLSELLVESGVSARVLPLALEERWFKPGLLDAVLAHERMNGEAVAERIRVALARASS